MDLHSLREKLRRLFWGRIRVHRLVPGHDRDNLVVIYALRKAQVHSLRSPVTVDASRCLQWKRMLPQGQRFDLFISPPPTQGGRMTLSIQTQVTQGLSLSSHVSVRDDLKKIMIFPQRRVNRIPFLKDRRPKDIMALYYPIVKECLSRTTLEKESGALFIWYNPSCRERSSRILCLVPDPGKRPPLMWKWL